MQEIRLKGSKDSEPVGLWLNMVKIIQPSQARSAFPAKSGQKNLSSHD